MTLAILAIDQARASGWALIVPGLQSRAGVARKAYERRAVVQEATVVAALHGHALVAVLEDHRAFHFGRGNMSVKSLLGMGAARGRWEQLLEEHGVRDVRQVAPSEWRRRVLGLRSRTRAEDAKRAAVLHAQACLGAVLLDDAAEAYCMALWAERNVEAAPARRRRSA